MATYDCGTYGAGNFGQGSCAASDTDGSAGGPVGGGSSSTGTGTQSGAGGLGGLLADTGYQVLVPVSLALAIIIAAAILLVKRTLRARKQKQA